MNLAERVRQAGVVGAGGGGFPTHVKLAAKADTVIANGAECEPLLHKDAAVMEAFASEMVYGVELAMEALGAMEGIIAIKAKNHHAVAAVNTALRGTRARLALLDDYYPAGDEFDLVFNLTGRRIPPGGIPINVGVVVNNVETFVNVAAAVEGRPVTHKMLTVTGSVRSPLTLQVPVGTSYRDCIEAAGGLTADDPVLCIGGLMMGQTTTDLDAPVTKTAGGVIVLPRSHPTIQRKLKPPQHMAAIGKSACDQCRYCTELCPRFLLGYAVEPHEVMRSLGFAPTGARSFNLWAALCCACGLCTLYSCPEGLFPKEACDDAKAQMRAEGVRWTGPADRKPHAMRDGRRVPVKSLIKRLAIEEYDVPAPFQRRQLSPRRLRLPLQQSAGTASVAAVRVGETVQAGQVLGAPPANALGTLLHAPRKATVIGLTDREVILEL